jgi:hypothetical protein
MRREAAFGVNLAREAGFDQIHFAWGGPLEEGHANYWRLHGPITLIEYDNTQNDANHIHSICTTSGATGAATSCANTTPTATRMGEPRRWWSGRQQVVPFPAEAVASADQETDRKRSRAA